MCKMEVITKLDFGRTGGEVCLGFSSLNDDADADDFW